MTVLDVMIAVGGLTDFADGNGARLVRTGEQGKEYGVRLKDLIKRGEVLADGRLPPILPIVLYNGQRPWRAPTDTARLVNALPGPLSALQPQVRYLLIDEARSKGLYDDHNLIAVLFKMAHAGSPQAFAKGLEKLKKLVQNNAELTHSVLFWLNVMLRKRGILGSVDENQLEGRCRAR